MIESIFSILERAKQSVPVNLKQLCDELGIKLIYTTNPTSNAGGYIECDNGEYTIYVDANAHPNRQRFTIAHELGHFFLHRDTLNSASHGVVRMDRDSDTTVNHLNTSDRIKETQANRFAAELLVPLEKLEDYNRKLNGDSGDLARIFEVSEDAMNIRMRSLRSH
jgi:Zn-dependent peptidase ImmA (M78 family)